MKNFHFRRGVIWRTRWSFVFAVLLVFLQSCALQHFYIQNHFVGAIGVDQPYLDKLVAERKVVVTKKKLLFMGDTMLARGIGDAVNSGADPYQYVRGILEAHDMRVANIETTIADPTYSQAASKPYTFNAPLRTLQTLRSVNIDLAAIANNHTGDYGRGAMLDMLSQYKQAGIETVGMGVTEDDAFQAKIVNLDGLKVACIAVNDIELAHTKVSSENPGTAYLDKARLSTSIQDARNQGADVVVVIPHWGVEYSLQQNDYQREWGHFMIDAGADLVIGSHPHVVQPTETYHNGQIVYSMGNFIFDGMEGDARHGQMISVEIQKSTTSNSSETKVGDAQSVGILIDAQGFPRPL